MEKNRTTVQIMGVNYTLSGVESPEYIHRVALYVDRKMQEIGLAQKLTTNHLAVLSCINIADELIKAQDENNRMRKELAATRQELSRLQRENTLLKQGRPVNQAPVRQ